MNKSNDFDVRASSEGFLLAAAESPGAILADTPVIARPIVPSEDAVLAREVLREKEAYVVQPRAADFSVLVTTVGELEPMSVEAFFHLQLVATFQRTDRELEVPQVTRRQLNGHVYLGSGLVTGPKHTSK